jgi:hypothetical protein
MMQTYGAKITFLFTYVKKSFFSSNTADRNLTNANIIR